ncbi:mucin-3A-like [Dreissena polymorpha]|uniref:mucin-3A-like n=1 Tax=Dreissena polymorpha TaxID=45954 RepID=UPI00226534A7|nr:mucin-3A-like [Dreissena polymorpha]
MSFVCPACIGLPESEHKSSSACYGDQPLMNATCPRGDVIAIKSLKVAAMPKEFNCDTNFTNNCCDVYDPLKDCVFDHSYIGVNAYTTACNGNGDCQRRAERIDARLKCNSSQYLSYTNYMHIDYFCINDNRIVTMSDTCSTFTSRTTGKASYIQSPGFPDIKSTTVSCSCSIETDYCTSSLEVFALQMLLQPSTTSGNCSNATQYLNLTLSDGRTLIQWGCANQSVRITEHTVSDTYVVLNFRNSYTADGGSFWLGFKSSESTANISINCPPVEQQHCRPSTTTSVSTTTTTISTTTTTSPSTTTTAMTSTTTKQPITISTEGNTTQGSSDTKGLLIGIIVLGTILLLGLLILGILICMGRLQCKKASTSPENANGSVCKSKDSPFPPNDHFDVKTETSPAPSTSFYVPKPPIQASIRHLPTTIAITNTVAFETRTISTNTIRVDLRTTEMNTMYMETISVGINTEQEVKEEPKPNVILENKSTKALIRGSKIDKFMLNSKTPKREVESQTDARAEVEPTRKHKSRGTSTDYIPTIDHQTRGTSMTDITIKVIEDEQAFVKSVFVQPSSTAHDVTTSESMTSYEDEITSDHENADTALHIASRYYLPPSKTSFRGTRGKSAERKKGKRRSSYRH